MDPRSPRGHSEVMAPKPTRTLGGPPPMPVDPPGPRLHPRPRPSPPAHPGRVKRRKQSPRSRYPTPPGSTSYAGQEQATGALARTQRVQLRLQPRTVEPAPTPSARPPAHVHRPTRTSRPAPTPSTSRDRTGHDANTGLTECTVVFNAALQDRRWLVVATCKVPPAGDPLTVADVLRDIGKKMQHRPAWASHTGPTVRLPSYWGNSPLYQETATAGSSRLISLGPLQHVS
ncbi:uncharacterized protein BXZ73DRAFT_75173 [Epithele typhae]|uniref:uncharacterized protein n=1 Tax=Epithele typhae TaxID=378194 RepID=UPI002007D79B|nr:uncharacterized protein BXZ73DRAFT_75173 [Epithele typhae]KAH9941210.1 hypothetical protein BXZ73DRAFT_75173 [Epithele typhae]